ncbi:MAG: NifB/NifX family molybdenum-iron cluster-binding protein [Candidatus Eiseniibacteriota bacterium]|jgi:predicted Fe-Mo cluster-binding NifX family protein
MQIVITSDGPDLDATMNPRFGRCPYFVYIDSETGAIHAESNPAVDDLGGAGVRAAQRVVDAGAAAVLTGRVGPNAMRVLESAGIEVYETRANRVRDALQEFRQGEPGDLARTATAVSSTPAPVTAATGAPATAAAGAPATGAPATDDTERAAPAPDPEAARQRAVPPGRTPAVAHPVRERRRLRVHPPGTGGGRGGGGRGAGGGGGRGAGGGGGRGAGGGGGRGAGGGGGRGAGGGRGQGRRRTGG